MIDTITFKCYWPLTSMTGEYWLFTRIARDLPVPDGEEEGCTSIIFTAYHQILGIHIQGHGNHITSVNVSLPRIIHGENATLIENQEQIDTALEHLIDIVGGIADTSSPILYFTRVDLCWHFQHSPASLIRAHRHCVFPRCQIKRREFSERSASWDYSDKRIIMYDKQFKELKRPGDIVRVEVQLRGKCLKRYLANGEEDVTQLRFALGYHAFREIMTTFAPSVIVNSSNNIYEGLANLENRVLAAGLESPIESFLTSINSRTARDWRKRMTAAHLRVENFQWENVLPEIETPAPIQGY